jgi:hypothetical protein
MRAKQASALADAPFHALPLAAESLAHTELAIETIAEDLVLKKGLLGQV